MENPCLTFVTPTLLTGDRSATNVVAHEIAHSWTGNLVTNASWAHFWINEGWTRFLERRILGRMFGDKTEQLHAHTGFLQMQAAVRSIGPNHTFTALVPDLSGGVDPDDSFSCIPYEKGFYFLYYLQTLVGGPEPFEAFLKAYILRFRFSTVTSTEFKDFYLSHFASVPAVSGIDWETWLYAPGMPPNVNTYDTSLAEKATDLATRWHTADILRLGKGVPDGVSAADVDGWSMDVWDAFLGQLGDFASASKLHRNTTRRLADVYGLDTIKNPDVRCAWLKLCIGAEDESALPGATAFLREQGRMKFLRPLYRALMASKMGRKLAIDLFAECRKGYHPIAEKMVATDLKC